jgi:hypothetical protein
MKATSLSEESSSETVGEAWEKEKEDRGSTVHWFQTVEQT